MKALVDAFNQEKALAGAFSVIVKIDCETDGSEHCTALLIIKCKCGGHSPLAAVFVARKCGG